MRPGDIYSSHSGKKVEISHTDAEGRLLLADAIELASKYNPMVKLGILKILLEKVQQ